MTDSPAIRTETLQVRRTALVAMRGPEPGASPPPRATVARLHNEIAAILAMPAVRERLATFGVDITAEGPEPLGALLKSDTERWAGVIAKAGIEDGLELIGGSCIVNPMGQVLAKAATTGDELVTARIDLDQMVPARKRWDFLGRRHPEHYGLLTQPAKPGAR